MPKKTDVAERILTFLLYFLAFGMANLNILMSIGTILLLVIWLYHPGPRNLWPRLRQNVPAMLLIGLFLLHFIWLFNTTDFTYAFKDIRIKLPLIVFGLVIGTQPIRERQLHLIFASLGAGTLVAAVSTYVNYFAADGIIEDPRALVTGISHIRLSVLMVIFVAGAIYFWQTASLLIRGALLLSVANIFVFFNLIQAGTGSALVIMLILWSVAYYGVKVLEPRGKLLLLGSWSLLIAAAAFFTYGYYTDKFTSGDNLDRLPQTTALGNNYYHLPDAGFVENGHYIFINVCAEELDAAWKDRSDVPLDAELEGTLIRYMTSKGLTKDHDGVLALSDADIANIESGIPSILYADRAGLALRFHVFLYSIHNYTVSGNASGLSFFQRVVYWGAALHLIVQAPILGTGTGDVKAAFRSAYEELDSSLDERYRNRAHNQFLTFFVTFGVLGALYFLCVFIYPWVAAKPDFLYTTVLLILFSSCLTEDTLETQAGVTIFAFFYSVFSSREKSWEKKYRPKPVL